MCVLLDAYSYTDRWNREYSEYLLTKDGFTLLVMGFGGR
jgi:phage regulator Rha-like protein